MRTTLACVVSTLVGIALFPLPAGACDLEWATIQPECAGYTITVIGHIGDWADRAVVVDLSLAGPSSVEFSDSFIWAKDFTFQNYEKTFPDSGLFSWPEDLLSGSYAVIGTVQMEADTVQVSGSFAYIPRVPDIEVLPSSLDLGSVTVGSSWSETLWIHSVGTDTLQVDSVLVSGQGYSASPVIPPAQAVPPGDSLEVTATFAPSAEGTSNGTVTVCSNDPDTPQVVVLLTGTGVVPRICLSPAGLDFGDVPVDSSRSKALSIQNCGSDTLQLDSLLVSGQGYSASRVIPPAQSVPPGDSLEVTVTFAPLVEGASAGALVVRSNDPDSPEVTVSLSGQGVVPPPPNHAPSITSSPVTGVTEDGPYAYDVEATDADGDSLTYLLTVRPAAMSISSVTGLVIWTPANADVGPNSVNVWVDDGKGGQANQAFTLTVFNAPPQITSSPQLTVWADSLYTYDVECDDEGSGSTSYSLPIAPSWLFLADSNSGLLTGTPAQADTGSTDVTVGVDDGNGGTDQQTYTLEVIVNHPPVVASVRDTEIRLEEQFEYQVQAHDPDGDSLRYRDDTDLFEIDPVTGLISLIAAEADTGGYRITVTVGDGKDTSAVTFVWTVTPVRAVVTTRQVVGPSGDLVRDPSGATVEIGAGALTDSTEIIIGYIINPPRLPDDLKGAFTTFLFGPDHTQFEVPVVIGVPYTEQDLRGAPPEDLYVYLYDLHTRAWEALPVEAVDSVNMLLLVRVWHLCYFQLALTNRQPQVQAIGDTMAFENTPFVLQVDATDPDGDSLSYSDDTPLFEIDTTNGLISFSPAHDDIGEHSVTVSVSDGEQSDSTAFALRITYVGDFNADGEVGLADFVLFMNAYGTTTDSENWNSLFDLNEDGVVGLGDFNIFVDNYGKGSGAGKLAAVVYPQGWMTLSANAQDPLSWTVRVGGVINAYGYGLAVRYDSDRLAFAGLQGDGLFLEHKGQLIVAGRFTGADQDATLRFRMGTVGGRDMRAIEAVEGVVLDAFGEASRVNVGLKEAQASYTLHRSLPNPFNSHTEIAYEIPAEAGTVQIDLEVYDLLGRRVRRLVSRKVAAGRHRVQWDGRDDNGHPVASGVYMCRLQTKEFAASKRMALIK